MKAGKFQVCGCLHPPRLSVLQLHEIREVAQEVLLGFSKEGEQLLISQAALALGGESGSGFLGFVGFRSLVLI